MLRFWRSDVEYYMSGACPYFAIAVGKLTNWPLAMLTDEAAEWESFGTAKTYPLIAHVFLITPDGMAFDAKGVRPIQAVRDEFHDLRDPRVEEITLKDLRSLMGDFRPLCRYNAREIKEARDVALRMYPELLTKR
jgi:hypothetical protein